MSARRPIQTATAWLAAHWFPQWHGHQDKHRAHAALLCSGRSVLLTCREYAIRTGQQYGIWGGLSEHDLAGLIRRRRRQRDNESGPERAAS
ncbi:WhiB family transcriptional regulator [Luteipulveratus mongoliensis]|uniref:4Fe-4S Wbl-type domain-containing protein n=1 Tax=Luteipulveratus mongoliensis TaxID=571913 RepID=A0A0K1JEL0_9MICO|nr:WhiB family transcriptional regulator [Luteipulveratus mongoliensis]AKU15141.1 hypothetical protein VV02_03450 [Luteipulveratus mongoliensis]